MKITEIVKANAKADRYTVYIDNEYWYILDIEIIAQNHLKPNMEVDEDFLEKLKFQAQHRKARERCYYLLGYRDHSKKELYDKLLKSVCPEVALEAIEMMEQQGLLDDDKYAHKLARYYLLQKKWGEKRASFEMQKKGIHRELIQAAIADCEVNTNEQIHTIIDKKYYDCLEDYKSKQKMIAGLMRLGYSYDDIKYAISTYEEKE